ncbi:hypothetical protein ACOMHN_022841 [Nucella lapillus]
MVISRCSREIESDSDKMATCEEFDCEGDSFILSYLFRVGDNTIRKIVLETCETIYEELKDDYLKVPSTADEWQGLADEFEQRWQFSNCIGAIDGKHIQIRSPGGGSDYFNYQSYNSTSFSRLWMQNIA